MRGGHLGVKARGRRSSRCTVGLALSTLAFFTFGVVAVLGESAGASVIPPSTVNELVSLTGAPTDASCPAGITPTFGSYTNLPAAISAASSGDTIYVCAGEYNLSSTATYSSNEEVVVNKSLTIDGTDWNTPYATSDTDAAMNSGTQSVLENGFGVVVQHANVTIQGFTFDANNFNNDSPDCMAEGVFYACSNSIDVQSNVSTPTSGDQGENNVTIDDNLFLDTGGSNFQAGDVHFGLGQDGPAADVTALDTGDVVEENVFYQAAGFENNAVEMSDTSGAVVESNTVNYPPDTDTETNALWFPGFDQATEVEFNTLNGGDLDSDLSTGIRTIDPLSGIKFVDSDMFGDYGDGCSSQLISGNTILGFVYGIAMISAGYNVSGQTLCAMGPSNFTITGNTLSNERLYGIYLSGTTGGVINNNDASNTDVEGYAPLNYTAGEYDFYDAWGDTSHNAWADGDNAGTGSTYPLSIGEIPLTSPTTTSTLPPTAPTLPFSTTTTTGPASTTIGAKPSVTTSGVTLRSGYKVSTTIHCAGTTCAGTLELTKTLKTKTEVGHTNKYRTKSTVEDLGKTRYSVAAGSKRAFSVKLNATGMKLVRAAKGRRYSCELVITSAAGTKREMISFDRP
jgi:parallel beta-helix repeat protein